MTLSQSFTAKLFGAVAAVAMVFTLLAPAVQAQDSDLQAQIDALLAQIAQLEAQLGDGGSSMSGSCSYTFTTPLSMGDRGPEVMKLQEFLNMDPETRVAATGVGSAGMETDYFGGLTKAAVEKFQIKYRADVLTPLGLQNATGYWGNSSIQKANEVCAGMEDEDGTEDEDEDDGDSAVLEGGAGSIDDVDWISGYNNEEIGEEEEDVVVAGLEIEADDGSDIEITALSLNFDQLSTGHSDFEDYATEVSIWFGGEKIAEVDADEFDDDDDFNSSVSLDSGVVIEAGDTEELLIAVSGINNLDSDDATDAWNVGVEDLRFRDAQGAVITTSTDVLGDNDDNNTTDSDEREFSFETLATAADLVVRFDDTDDDVNNSRVIDIDDNDDTDNVEVLAFSIEVEGSSDVELKDLDVNFDSTGFDLQDGVEGLRIMHDDDSIADENMPSAAGTDETITFEDIDMMLDAGETYEFVVEVDLASTADGLADGDTISAQISSTERNSSDIEDENGDNVDNGDRKGQAVGDAHALYENGISITLDSVESAKTFTADESGESDRVTYTYKFTVTNDGDDDIYFENDVARDASPADSTDGHAWATTTLASTGTTSPSAFISANDTDSDDTANSYIIDAGQSREFTFTVELEAGTDGQVQTKLTGFKWGLVDDGDGDNLDKLYDFNLDDFLGEAMSVTVQ